MPPLLTGSQRAFVDVAGPASRPMKRQTAIFKGFPESPWTSVDVLGRRSGKGMVGAEGIKIHH